eukprot:4523912-Prymnesium_polylepis.1
MTGSHPQAAELTRPQASSPSPGRLGTSPPTPSEWGDHVHERPRDGDPEDRSPPTNYPPYRHYMPTPMPGDPHMPGADSPEQMRV